MKNEFLCRPRQLFKCVYITKDNVEEFANTYGMKQEHTFEYHSKYVDVHYKNMTWHIPLDAYMVDEQFGWNAYSRPEFDEIYDLQSPVKSE